MTLVRAYVACCVLSLLLWGAGDATPLKTNGTESQNEALASKVEASLLKSSPQRIRDDDEHIRDVVIGVIKQLTEERDGAIASCSEDEYFDENTGNCEDCILLCKGFNQKMCQTNCETTYTALKFDLPHLGGSLAGLSKAVDDERGEIEVLSEENEKMREEVQELSAKGDERDESIGQLFIITAVLVAIVAIVLVAAFSYWYVLKKWRPCKRENKRCDVASSGSEGAGVPLVDNPSEPTSVGEAPPGKKADEVIPHQESQTPNGAPQTGYKPRGIPPADEGDGPSREIPHSEQVALQIERA